MKRLLKRVGEGVAFSRKGIVLLLALTASLAAAAADRALKVWQADGQVLTINLADEPRTTYNNGNLMITSKQISVTLLLEKVRRYTYVDVANGIDERQGVRAAFSNNGEVLTLTGLSQGTRVMLYNTAGQLLRHLTADGGGKLAVSVAALPTGVYVVKVKDVTDKLTKR